MPNETRAARYHRARVRAGAGALAVSLLVLVACGPWGLGPWPAARLQTLTAGWPLGEAAATALFAAFVLAATHAARYPFDRHREWTLEHRYGLARIPSAAWARAYVRGAAAGVALGVAAALVVRAAWAWCGAVVVAGGGGRLLRGPPRVDGGGAAPPRRLRRPAAAAPAHARGPARSAGPPCRGERRNPRVARRRRLDACPRRARRPRPHAPDHPVRHAGRDPGRRRDRGRRRPRARAPRPWRRLARRGVAARRAAADARRRGAGLVASRRTGGRVAARSGDRRRRGGPRLRRSRGCRWRRPWPWWSTGCSIRSASHCRVGASSLPTPSPCGLTGGADAFVTSMRRLSQTNLVDDEPPRLARVLSSHPPVRDRVLAALRHAEAASDGRAR